MNFFTVSDRRPTESLPQAHIYTGCFVRRAISGEEKPKVNSKFFFFFCPISRTRVVPLARPNRRPNVTLDRHPQTVGQSCQLYFRRGFRSGPDRTDEPPSGRRTYVLSDVSAGLSRNTRYVVSYNIRRYAGVPTRTTRVCLFKEPVKNNAATATALSFSATPRAPRKIAILKYAAAATLVRDFVTIVRARVRYRIIKYAMTNFRRYSLCATTNYKIHLYIGFSRVNDKPRRRKRCKIYRNC